MLERHLSRLTRKEVRTMRARTALAGLGLGVLMAAVVSSASSGAATPDATTLSIRHAAVGCHVWSSGGAGVTTKTLILRQGQSFTVHNRDNCGHELTQVNGPEQVRFLNPVTGASVSGVLHSLRPGVRVNLDKAGTYVFTTRERDDLAYGADTDAWFGFAKLGSSGPDNTLTLVVRVIPDHNHPAD
jgi:hypothetical protein